ncbi:hypothetical protein BC937DRAFT_93522 [Endogone sp. FLAS-F59071]|nr:hypothetical protein BC937DRAFT_93522 [Endogone sp. FLAS-F59071]|eukprot:RUS14636.1 hypothetical protein BC937DRAFT_93522 [Endogone sp. FLAS-F59071]
MTFDPNIFYYTVQTASILPSLAIVVLYTSLGTHPTLVALALSMIGASVSNSWVAYAGYSENPQTLAKTAFCRVQGIFTTIFTVMPVLFTFCITLNLWLMIVRKSTNTEARLFRWYIFSTLLITTLFTILGIAIGDWNDKRAGGYGNAISMSNYSCVLQNALGRDLGLVTPFGIFAFGGVLLLAHITWSLFRHRQLIRRNFDPSVIMQSNRGKAMGISLSICIRMLIFCVSYFGLAINYVAQRIDDEINPTDPHPPGSIKIPLAFFGFIIFLVFGTTLEARRQYIPKWFPGSSFLLSVASPSRSRQDRTTTETYSMGEYSISDSQLVKEQE